MIDAERHFISIWRWQRSVICRHEAQQRELLCRKTRHAAYARPQISIGAAVSIFSRIRNVGHYHASSLSMPMMGLFRCPPHGAARDGAGSVVGAGTVTQRCTGLKNSLRCRCRSALPGLAARHILSRALTGIGASSFCRRHGVADGRGAWLILTVSPARRFMAF